MIAQYKEIPRERPPTPSKKIVVAQSEEVAAIQETAKVMIISSCMFAHSKIDKGVDNLGKKIPGSEETYRACMQTVSTDGDAILSHGHCNDDPHSKSCRNFLPAWQKKRGLNDLAFL